MKSISRRIGKPKTPPRRVFVGMARKPAIGRRSLMANSNQIDILEKVRKMLDTKEEDGEVLEANDTSAGRLKVAVRVRPMNAAESHGSPRNIISVASPNMLVFDPKVEQEDFFFHNRKQIDVTAKKYKNQKFAFDHVYDFGTENSTIFDDVMKPLLNTLLSGINCSVFAYGATGSGKTFTMLGNRNCPGLTFLTMNELYRRLEELKEKFETEIVISYYEVYNEQVRDLLNPGSGTLQVREVGNGIDIANLTFHRPKDVNDLLKMLDKGNGHRSQHPTDHNAESSRSHALLQVHIRMRERYASLNTNSKTAKLVMVDLAGSEKGAATGAKGQRFREGANINRSLLALSNCISALASGRRFFSYRDSKLTRILKDSLGGNCRTVMIANISPSNIMYEETLNTLRYAEKAKKIACTAKTNVMTVHTCLTQYTKVVEEMASKIQSLESATASREKAIDDLMSVNGSLTEEVADLKLKLKEAQDKIELLNFENHYYRTKREGATGEDFSSESWIPTPVQIPDMQTIVETWKKHNETKLVLRPILERFITDFQLTENRYNKLNALATSTGDARYRKSASNLFRKLEVMIADIKNLLEKIQSGKEGYSSCILDHKTVWESVVSAKYPSVQVTPQQLYNYYVNEFSFADMNTQNAILQAQLAKVLDECSKQEGLLEDAAVMTNQMKNLLQHYGHATPKLSEKYDEFVSKYTGNLSLVRFAEVDASPVTTRGEQSETPEQIQKCDLEEFYIQMVKKLRATTTKLRQRQLRKQLVEALSNIDLRGCQLVSPTDQSFRDSFSSSESFGTDSMEQMDTEEEPVHKETITFSETWSEPNPDMNILGEPMNKRPREATAKPTTAPQLDNVDASVIAPPVITAVRSLTRDAANTTIVLAKNLEETFTKEDELIENNAPVVSSSTDRTEPVLFKKPPTITQIVNERSAATSLNFNGAMTSAATAEARERPVFLPIQQPHIPKPENLPSTLVGPGPSTSVDCFPAPSAQPVKRNIRTSPRLQAKKGAVNYHPKPTTYSAGRVGPSSSGSKVKPRAIFRGKSTHQPNFPK